MATGALPAVTAMVTATMMAAAITGASAAASTIAVAASGAIAIAVAALAITGTAARTGAVVAYAVAISVDVSRAGSHCGRSIGDGCSSRLGHRVEVDDRHSGDARRSLHLLAGEQLTDGWNFGLGIAWCSRQGGSRHRDDRQSGGDGDSQSLPCLEHGRFPSPSLRHGRPMAWPRLSNETPLTRPSAANPCSESRKRSGSRHQAHELALAHLHRGAFEQRRLDVVGLGG